MEEDTEIVPSGVVVGIRDVRKAEAHLVDHILVLEGVRDQDHPLCEIALVEHGAVPGEDHRFVLDLPLLHAVRKVFQDGVVAPCLLFAVKEIADIRGNEMQLLPEIAVYILVVLVEDAVPNDRIHPGEIGGHEGRRHLRIVRVGLDHPDGRFGAVVGGLHIPVVVGNGQPLILRPVLRDLQHAVYCILRLVKAERPEPDDDLHAVVGPGHLKGFLPVPDRFVKVRKDFGRDSVHRIDAADARPGGGGPLHCRKAQKVVAADRIKDGQECFVAAAVRIFTDRLANALLELCGQQELREQLVQLRIPGLYDAPDQRHGDDHRVVVA